MRTSLETLMDILVRYDPVQLYFEDVNNDSEGSLELKPFERAIPAAVVDRIPVEAETTDQNGTNIHVLLHVVNGIVNELEIYKDDGSRIKQMPNPTDFKLVVAPPRPPSKQRP